MNGAPRAYALQDTKINASTSGDFEGKFYVQVADQLSQSQFWNGGPWSLGRCRRIQTTAESPRGCLTLPGLRLSVDQLLRCL